MKKAKPDVIAALTHLCGGRLLVGDESSHTLNNGELVIEVTVRVRNRVTDEIAVAYRAQALAELVAHPFRVEHCRCVINKGKRGLFNSERDCSGRVVAVVVSKSVYSSKEPKFTFVCVRHREKHGEDPKRVLAVVDLPGFELVRIRQLLELKRKADDARYCNECCREKVDGACPVCRLVSAQEGA